ncbi:HAUS augmin-like complex subunit 8 [Platysternon megacephalum]|uniref:HAUS augmin-like complex subunit 8 n=1 Tax=Platysternon megacephalum TaxID=55544 RepID=A0A4D9EI30_9SAUR|nr:HAUS augmin-like complex subunit 8 [Platysternon megacephalum]
MAEERACNHKINCYAIISVSCACKLLCPDHNLSPSPSPALPLPPTHPVLTQCGLKECLHGRFLHSRGPSLLLVGWVGKGSIEFTSSQQPAGPNGFCILRNPKSWQIMS